MKVNTTRSTPADTEKFQIQGVLAARPAMGLADHTPIPTPDGWINVGDIGIGQKAFDERGEPCTVVGVYPQREQPLYRVSFDRDKDRQGNEVEESPFILAGLLQPWVPLTHSLRAKIHKHTRRLEHWASRLIPFTTEDIQRHLLYEAGTCIEAMYSIPLARPLQLPERDLVIDPYLLGVWLGDGSSHIAAITCQQDDEPHYRRLAIAAGENWRIAGDKEGVLLCTLTRPPPCPSRLRFTTRLRELGVLNNKHIPTIYLRAGNAQRLTLLQGLMDSDGHIEKRAGLAEYVSTSEKLARGVLELALTLGQKASILKGDAVLRRRRISDKWRICFTPTICAPSLSRKADRLAEFLKVRETITLPRMSQRYIRSVEAGGAWAATCIEVDSPSRLFLAGRYLIPVLSARPPSS